MSAAPGAVREHFRTATELITNYDTDDLLLYSPRRCLLGRGSQALLRPRVARADLARHAGLAALTDAVAGGPGVVAGAIPFAEGYPARLIVPERLWSVPNPDAGPSGSAATVRPTGWQATPTPTRCTYAAAVGEALRRIGRGELDKLVLARALDIDFAEQLDVAALLRALLARDPGGYGYAIPLDGGRVFLGASPELLVARHGRRVAARPLAGSAGRSSDPAEDRQRSRNLLASAKDSHEHRLVVQAVVAALEPHCTSIAAAPSPELTGTAAMWHLATTITGTLRDPDTTSLDLALALHPTPAVCGTPTAAAYAAIRELEPFERGLFAGAVGWLDSTGDGEWAVAIRCAEVGGHRARLFAGAGIVAGSSPDGEAGETGAKFRTVLRALGIEYDG